MNHNTHWAGWDAVADGALGAADGFSPGPYTFKRKWVKFFHTTLWTIHSGDVNCQAEGLRKYKLINI